MTIEEKITRYRGIPKLIKDLQIDKEICTSVKSVQFDSIGAAHGSAENRTEQKLLVPQRSTRRSNSWNRCGQPVRSPAFAGVRRKRWGW